MLRVVRYDKSGQMACRRPLWLIVISPRRHELTTTEVYEANSQRFDLEHFFRFGK